MSSVYHAISIHSSRPAPSLQVIDYDHEIQLIDHTRPPLSQRTRSQSASEGSRRDSLWPDDEEANRRRSAEEPRRKLKLGEELARRRYTKQKYQDRRPSANLETTPTTTSATPADITPTATDVALPAQVADVGEGAEVGGVRPVTGDSVQPAIDSTQADPDAAIDVLWENERGGFLCGIPLFSSKALGIADAPAWENVAHKASATDITNAQVPDPSWHWAWPEWRINQSNLSDEDGWEYSFAFSHGKLKFSWHPARWYNSFVRRRAWIRRRTKKKEHSTFEAHRLNSDYFTIRPSVSIDRNGTNHAESVHSRYSITQLANREMEVESHDEEIRDIERLMHVLKTCRIDRERMEAVENFIKNGGEQLFYLKDHMREIMNQFVFQASRRLLLDHLSQIHNETVSRRDKERDGGKEAPEDDQKVENLDAAIHAADEQVKRLEYWSDIRELVEEGKTRGGVDDSKGWSEEKWTGVDGSGPSGPLGLDSELPGATRAETANGSTDKGKGKEKEEH